MRANLNEFVSFPGFLVTLYCVSLSKIAYILRKTIKKKQNKNTKLRISCLQTKKNKQKKKQTSKQTTKTHTQQKTYTIKSFILHFENDKSNQTPITTYTHVQKKNTHKNNTHKCHVYMFIT